MGSFIAQLFRINTDTTQAENSLQPQAFPAKPLRSNRPLLLVGQASRSVHSRSYRKNSELANASLLRCCADLQLHA